jgi:putative inorganic carbon (HCO3(-)) transporter
VKLRKWLNLKSIIQHPWILVLSLLFIGLNGYFIYNNNYFLNAIPLVLLILYMAFYYLESTFLLVALLTPLSVNLEEFTNGEMGLFLPTEPILLGILVLLLFKQLKTPFIDKEVWKNPIVWSLGFYIGWIFITSITSTSPLISFKFLLMKLWFILPLIFIGTFVFKNYKNISRFIWLYAIGITVVILYTLIRHYGYGFGEEEGHWVMSPFFKDHTIYGASVAISVFFILGLLLHKHNGPLIHFILLVMLSITALGLYFSYTRGAWLSVFVAVIVWLLIKYKVKFKYLLVLGILVLSTIYFSWDKIEMELARNKAEHTTTAFDERLQSATNVTSDASNLERLNRWNAAWEMYKKKPVFGFGPGTYAFEYAPYQDPDMLTIISTNFGNAGNAHSEFLGPMAEMGTFGILAMILFVVALFYKGITLYNKFPENSETNVHLKRLLLFVILAMSTYFFHGLLNNYLDTDKAAVPIYGVCAIIIALEIKIKQDFKKQSSIT